MITLPDLRENIPDSLLDNIPVGIILFDKNGEIHFVNKAFHEFEMLYPDVFNKSLIGRNIFSQNILSKKSISNELEELKSGYPFESEIEQISSTGKVNVRLIIKGTPNYEDEEFAGGILLIEDLRIIHKTNKEFLLRSDFLESATTQLSEAFIVINPNGIIKFFSGNVSSIFTEANPTLNVSLSNLTDAKLYEELSGFISSAINSKNIVKAKVKIERKDSTRFFEIKFLPQIDKKGFIQFIYIFFFDISSTENELTRLKEDYTNTEFYSKIIEASGRAFFVIDNHNNIISWDDNCEIIFGKNRSEVEKSFIGGFVPSLNNQTLSEVRTVLKTENLKKIIINHQYAGEKIIECSFIKSSSDEDKLLVLCEDITKRINGEKESDRRIKVLYSILSNADFLITQIDSQGKFIFVNKIFCETFNLTEQEAKQKTIYDLIQPEYLEKNIFDLSSIKTNISIRVELPLKTGNGNYHSYSVTIIPETGNGEPESYNCYLKDINEQAPKGKEADLLHLMLNTSNDGIMMGQNGKVVFANKAFAEIFNYETGDELTGKDILDFVSNDDILKVAEYLRLLERKKGAPSRFDFLGKKKNGSVFHAEISAGMFEFDQKNYTAVIVRDVTERIRAQKAIRESEEKYRNITENIDDFLFTFERMGLTLRPVFCTSSVQKITGYTQSDFLGDSKLFLKTIHPDDFQVFKPKLMNLLKSRIQNSGEFEFRIINKHGNIVWVRTKLNLLRVGAGRIQRIYGLVSDITFRKRAEEELKKSTQNLIKLNETKDRFISIISHDLRTPFSSILGFVDLLINDKELTEQERNQYYKYIQESSKSMLALVNSLLDWTRLQTGRIKFEPQKIDASQIIKEAVTSLSGLSIQKEVEIVNLLRAERLIFADKSLLLQVFSNLISNAIKFTNKGGKIYLSAIPSENPRFLEFSVKDTGVGIKPENINKLFSVESKFTSEGTSGEKGSGLGLSLVREIVEKHNGKIWVKSKFGEGSDFRFTMPIASAKILIVDDNKTDRLLYSKILKNITPDYEIEVASNGKEALEKITLSPPALVITDHSMPVMNGYEFVLELQKIEMKGKPPVIVLSSDIDRNAINDYNSIGIEYVFHKPVNLSHFKQAVEKSLRKSFSPN